MKILIDTNVILDIALERKPFVKQAAILLKAVQQYKIQLFMTATTVTDLYYITRKEKGKETALEFIEDLLQFVEVASVDKHVIIQALHSDIPDFEDAIQECSAKNEAIKIIVTRNEEDFKKSDLEIHSPESFLNTLPPDVEPSKRDNHTEHTHREKENE